MRTLRKIFKSVLILVLFNHSNGYERITDDAIIVEASDLKESSSPRKLRHLYYALPPQQISVRATWANAAGEGGACLTSSGRLGSCQSFRNCYPYFKIPDLGAWESWVLGNYDTCTYASDDGRQAFGVCCTNPITPSTPPENENKIELPNRTPAMQNSNNYPNWPPPVPTHPPDHTAATHPTAFVTNAGPIKSTTPTPTPQQTTTTTRTTTTRKTTTWGTKPPSSSVVWPPPQQPQKPMKPPTFVLPPSTTKRPSYVIPTTTESSEDQGFNSASCGAKNGFQDQERIVGGLNADPNEWPWVAVLFNGGRQFCGGSLIDNIHIISAAHCVAHMTSWDVARLTVRLGEHDIRVTTEVKHEERKIKRVVRHRGFDSRTLYNDIAILTMDRPVTFSKAIKPVCLPAGGGSRLYNGLQATVVGWGSLRESGPQPSVLQKVTLPIWSNAECRQKYGAAAPGGIIESMLCAGVASKDSCSGDSGGPLTVNDGRWTQVGIVSWGIGCGKGQYPGVYTRITSFMDWLRKNSQDV